MGRGSGLARRSGQHEPHGPGSGSGHGRPVGEEPGTLAALSWIRTVGRYRPLGLDSTGTDRAPGAVLLGASLTEPLSPGARLLTG